jgi:hypothetical protein
VSESSLGLVGNGSVGAVGLIAAATRLSRSWESVL